MVKFEDKGHERELMLMERIGEDGERREVDPAEVARVDQILARQDEISHRLTYLYNQIKQAASEDDVAVVANLTTQLRGMLYDYFPQPSGRQDNREVFDFVLYLIGLLNSASEAQRQSYETADALLHGLVTLLPGDHPVVQSAYFQQDAILGRISDVLPEGLPEELLSRLNPRRGTYTCGDGTKLQNVHTREDCVGVFCVIHNPAPGPWDTWPTSWMEPIQSMGRVCPCGIVHVCIEDLLVSPAGLTEVHDHGASGCECPCDMSRVEMVINDDGELTGFRPITQ